MVMRIDTIDVVGFYDESFDICGFETQDYFLRMARAGMRFAYCNDAIAYHHGGITLKHSCKKYGKYMKRNASYFNTKWGTSAPEDLYDQHLSLTQKR